MTNTIKNNLLQAFNPAEKKYISTIDMRKKALAAFNAHAVPGHKTEAWQNTDISFLKHKTYKQAAYRKILPETVKKYLLPEFNTNLIVLLNGYLQIELSYFRDHNITIKNISSLSENEIEKLFKTSKLSETNLFTALNAAYAYDGLLIEIPENTIAKPIHIINLFDDEQAINTTRNKIIANTNSQVEIIETSYSLSDNDFLICNTSELIQQQNSHVKYLNLQNFNNQAILLNTFYADLAKDATLNNLTFSLNGKLIRNESYINLNRTNAEANLDGLFLPAQEQIIDQHTYIKHLSEQCRSNQCFRGIAKDNSIGIYSGLVYVAPNAQQTNSSQSSKNIVLNNEATIYSKPQLEIYADDVQCSHGSTTGQLDQLALFYMQSRGIKKDDAKIELLSAFSGEITDKITNKTLKNRILEKINQKLKVK